MKGTATKRVITAMDKFRQASPENERLYQEAVAEVKAQELAARLREEADGPARGGSHDYVLIPRSFLREAADEIDRLLYKNCEEV